MMAEAPVFHWADSALLLVNLIISLINPVINTSPPNPDQWKPLAIGDAQLCQGASK